MVIDTLASAPTATIASTVSETKAAEYADCCAIASVKVALAMASAAMTAPRASRARPRGAPLGEATIRGPCREELHGFLQVHATSTCRDERAAADQTTAPSQRCAKREQIETSAKEHQPREQQPGRPRQSAAARPLRRQRADAEQAEPMPEVVLHGGLVDRHRLG
jgi:hypothetical protein